MMRLIAVFEQKSVDKVTVVKLPIVAPGSESMFVCDLFGQ